MNLVSTIAVVTGGAFAAVGAAKVARLPAMRKLAQHVGFSVLSYQLIGAAEIAGGVGLLLGPAHPVVGYAAASGLLALLAGAAVVHLRQGDGVADLAPAAVFATGTVAYVLALGASR